MWQHVVILLALSSLCSAATHDPLVVSTKSGKVRGKTVSSATGIEVDAWYSIPYARPPLGDLRFRHPKPIDPWQDIKDTTGLPNTCVQIYDDFFGDFEGAQMWNANTPMSEDCLYLSVFVPKPRPTNTPVLVWIYGGGFYSGTSTLDVYDYRTFAADQNIITVAMQYRVANLGFLYMGTDQSPGNAGLFDQMLALEWIHDNIEKFGGNPNNITIMGESAGAASVGMHLMSSLSRNLFHQAILQSGAPNVPWGIIGKKEAKVRGQKLAETVGCPTDMEDPETIMDCLRTVNASVLVNSETTNGIADFAFVPIVDGVFFDELPIDTLKHGTFKKTNILLGSNTEEGYYFLMYFLPNLLKREENILVNRENFTNSVRGLFPYFNELTLQAIMYEYTDWLDPKDGAKNRNALDKMVGDYFFTCNVNEFAEFYAENGNNVYMYYFKHRSSGNKWPKWTGVLHADEIAYVFGEPLSPKYPEYTDEEQELSRQMMTYWGNFVRTGNPSKGDERSFAKARWPEWKSSTKEYLILEGGQSGGVGRGPRLNQCAFWKSFLPQLLKHSAHSSTPKVCPSSSGDPNYRSSGGRAVAPPAGAPVALIALGAALALRALHSIKM